MAKYTTQIRTIVESGYPLFDFEYPVFDPKYKPVLEQKIINRYYFGEIGFETVGQFKHFLKTRLNEIMPYYNEQYLALDVFKKMDPYINKDLETTETRTNKQDLSNTTEETGERTSDQTGSRTTDGESTATSSGTNSGRTVFSDTPQARLQGKDYATNLTELDDSNTNETAGTSKETDKTTNKATDNSLNNVVSTGTVTTTDEYIQTIRGFDGMKYASEVYLGVKETIVNFDEMILDHLNDLFMNIY